MRLGSHITAQTDPALKCRTCYILGTLTDEDRADFAAAYAHPSICGNAPASVEPANADPRACASGIRWP